MPYGGLDQLQRWLIGVLKKPKKVAKKRVVNRKAGVVEFQKNQISQDSNIHF